MDNAIKLYVKQHGDTVAGRKLEFIRKDTGGVAPDVAKRIAREFVVNENVDILAGFVLTPNALAAADVSVALPALGIVDPVPTGAALPDRPARRRRRRATAPTLHAAADIDKAVGA